MGRRRECRKAPASRSPVENDGKNQLTSPRTAYYQMSYHRNTLWRGPPHMGWFIHRRQSQGCFVYGSDTARPLQKAMRLLASLSNTARCCRWAHQRHEFRILLKGRMAGFYSPSWI